MSTTTTSTSTAVATIRPAFTESERLALAGYLAGYRGMTREAYTLDLRQFVGWCRDRSLPLSVRRADIETFARDLEDKGRARATVTSRLSTVAGFYKYAVEEELLGHSPAAHVRRPRLDYESHATGLDRNEVGAILAAAAERARTAREAFPQWGRAPVARRAVAVGLGNVPESSVRVDDLAVRVAQDPGGFPGVDQPVGVTVAVDGLERVQLRARVPLVPGAPLVGEPGVGAADLARLFRVPVPGPVTVPASGRGFRICRARPCQPG